MKRLLGLIAILAVSVSFTPLRAAIVVALCGTPADPGGTSVSTMSVTCTPPASSYLVIFSVTATSTTQTIADGGVGNTFTVPSLTNLASFPNWAKTSALYNLWVVSSPVITATTFTVTNSTSRSFSSLTVMAVTGITSPVTDCGNNQSQGTSPTSTSCTTAGADALIGMGNRYAAGGLTGRIGTTSLFVSVGSGAGTGWKTAGPGSASVDFDTGSIFSDIFLLAIKSSVAASSSTQIGGFLVGP